MCAELVDLEIPLEQGSRWSSRLDLLSKAVQGGGAGNVPEHLPFLFCGSHRVWSEQLQEICSWCSRRDCLLQALEIERKIQSHTEVMPKTTIPKVGAEGVQCTVE